MYRKPKYPELKNIVFLDNIGETLRQATRGIAHDELPQDIQALLVRLAKVEAPLAIECGHGSAA